MRSSVTTFIGGKRQRSQEDPDHGAQKRPRNTCSPDEGVSRNPTGFMNRMPTPLHQILVLTVAMTLPKNSLHIKLNVHLLIQKHSWRPVYRRKCTLIYFTK